jgi:RHS repeat-associated protein
MQMPGRNASTSDYRYGFNGMEQDDEIKGSGNSYDFGARMHDSRLGRWLSLDPLASGYPSYSSYSFAANIPILFIDEGGKYLRLSFESKEAYTAYVKLVNASLEGQFKVSFEVRKDREGYDFEVKLIPTGGDVSELSEKGKAFYERYKEVVDDKNIARQEIVIDDPNVHVGDFPTNKLDMGDIAKFDEAGEGAASSLGALIHETVEQLEKKKRGLDPGEAPLDGAASTEYQESHAIGIAAENEVNGNERNGSVFTESDGTQTLQEIEVSSTGEFTITKTKIE